MTGDIWIGREPNYAGASGVKVEETAYGNGINISISRMTFGTAGWSEEKDLSGWCYHLEFRGEHLASIYSLLPIPSDGDLLNWLFQGLGVRMVTLFKEVYDRGVTDGKKELRKQMKDLLHIWNGD